MKRRKNPKKFLKNFHFAHIPTAPISPGKKSRRKRGFLLHLGNFLMLTAIAILIYIYFPFIMFYINPPKLNTAVIGKNFYIQIPKISAQAPVIPNVDPWNEAVYGKALQKGVAQAKGTSLPGQTGTIFLFAHSSEDVWLINRDNIAFFQLGQLQKNDIVYLYYKGKKYVYRVFDEKVVWPNDVQYLLNTKKNQLILQTCTPIGTSFQRLLVFATLTN